MEKRQEIERMLKEFTIKNENLDAQIRKRLEYLCSIRTLIKNFYIMQKTINSKFKSIKYNNINISFDITNYESCICEWTLIDPDIGDLIMELEGNIQLQIDIDKLHYYSPGSNDLNDIEIKEQILKLLNIDIENIMYQTLKNYENKEDK